MIKYENNCCSCAVPSYPCQGDSCPNRHVAHYYCDECDKEARPLYEIDGLELCNRCALEHLEVVEGSE